MFKSVSVYIDYKLLCFFTVSNSIYNTQFHDDELTHKQTCSRYHITPEQVTCELKLTSFYINKAFYLVQQEIEEDLPLVTLPQAIQIDRIEPKSQCSSHDNPPRCLSHFQQSGQ